ncbi:hypothetical protein Tco_0053178 [Tanacetum coccineum]
MGWILPPRQGSVRDGLRRFEVSKKPTICVACSGYMFGAAGLDEVEVGCSLQTFEGSTLKQSTADPANIPKGYTQAASSKVHTAPNYTSHLDEIICSFFSNKACHAYNSDDEDLFSKYQENRANGRQEKKIVAIEDSNSKALVATDNKEDID